MFLIATTLWIVLVPLVLYPFVDSFGTQLLAQSAAFAVIIGIAWAILRWEGLGATDVGLSWRDVLPGALPIIGIYVFLNVVGALAMILSGESASFAIPETHSSLTQWLGVGAVQLLFVGIAEEFAFRAYLQNKLIALVGGGYNRVRKGGAIVLGAGLFTIVHIPQRILIQDLSAPAEIIQTLGIVVVLGLVLGVLYEYTRNVVFVGVLHGTFNWQAFVVADAPINLAYLVTLPAFPIVAWAYRRWARTVRSEHLQPPVQAGSKREFEFS